MKIVLNSDEKLVRMDVSKPDCVAGNRGPDSVSNTDMIDKLREFVARTANRSHIANPAELEAMTEAATIVLENSHTS